MSRRSPDRRAPDEPTEPAPDATLEEVQNFYSALSTSIAAGDLGFSLDNLHPVVFEAFPDSCPARGW